MTVEFNKLMQQVVNMGKMIENLDFDLRDRLALATRIFESCDDLHAVRERMEWVKRLDIKDYRGAMPLEAANAEEINRIVSAPPTPAVATILAVDGSQVYPNEQGLLHYYLLNIGTYVYHHGLDRKPQAGSQPHLVYHEKFVYDAYGAVIGRRTVDDRRTLAELETLAAEAWRRKRQSDPLPIIAFYDNRLLYFPVDRGHRGENLLKDYLGALVHLHDAGASLLGYVDNPRNRRVMQLLFLMMMDSEDELKAHQRELTRTGPLEGLYDQQFFDHILKPGERSAIMVQHSPQNQAFKARGASYEIAFFYLKVTNQQQALNSEGRGFAARVVRIDVPLWVARDRKQVDAVHAMILAQCQLQGRNPYPYALTRADELAYVSSKEKDKLEQLVRLEVRKVKKLFLNPDAMGAKTRGKELARGEKRYHEM